MDKILIGDYGRIDFDAPISMTDEQYNAFIALLRRIFHPDIVEEERGFSGEFRDGDNRLGMKEIHPRWSAPEFKVLLQLEDCATVSRMIGRSEMSIMMRAGNVIQRLTLWCEDNNIDLVNITVGDIERFLREKEEIKIENRRKKKLRTETIHKIENMLNDRKEPCMIGDRSFYGGECADGFHEGCKTCPRSRRYLRSQEDIDYFNQVYEEEF
jgi:hypothetical protein